MELVELTCENCGGPLSIDATKELAVCQFCGTVFKLVDDRPIIINQYYDDHPDAKQALRQSVADLLQQRVASGARDTQQAKAQPAAKEQAGRMVFGVVFALVIALSVGGFFLFWHRMSSGSSGSSDIPDAILSEWVEEAEQSASSTVRTMPQSDLMLDVVQAALGTRTPTPDQLARITSLRLSSDSTGGVETTTVEWALDGGVSRRLVETEAKTLDSADFTAFTGLVSLDLTNFDTFDLESKYGQTFDSLVNLRELFLGPMQWEPGMVPVPAQLEVLAGVRFSSNEALGNLRSMTALRQLEAQFDAEVTDYSAVTGLPNLTAVEITFPSSAPANFGWLEDLASLESLTVNAYSATDFGFLNGLTGLTQLHLKSAQNLKTLDVVRLLPRLESLTVERSAAMTLAPLASLTSLKSLTLVYNTGLTDISAVSSLTGLEQFTCQGSNRLSTGFTATDLTQLTSATVRQDLLPWLAGAPLTDLTVVGGLDDPAALLGFTELTQLQLSEGWVSSFAGLERLGLTRLELDDTSVWWDDNGQHLFEVPVSELVLNQVDGLHINSTDVVANTALKSLTFTYVSVYQENDPKTADFIAPILSQLTGLESLDLTGSGLSSLEFARNLTNLQSLTISDTYVSDIAPLKSLAALRTLVCFDCPIVNPGGVSSQVILIN